MIKKIVQSIVAVALVLGAINLVVAPQAVALDPADQIENGIDAAGGGGASNNNLPRLIKNIVNILLYVLGAISVIMIVIGGIRYATSGGDSSGVTNAKNTVLYSVVGLVVAMLAYAIVNWVIDAF